MTLDSYVSWNEFYKVYTRLIDKGKMSTPRGLPVLECEHFSYELEPYVRFTNFKDRKLNINYIKKEFLWYLRGDRYDMSICDHAKIWGDVKVLDSRGLPYINSNYGHYVFTKGGMTRVVRELIKDRDSRRASIIILGSEPEHFIDEAKDVPCTYSLNFRIRDNRVNMSVHMRSQDAVFGMGNDAPCFSFIHEMVFVYLKEVYPELGLGTYYHTADSFHVYERHFDLVRNIVGTGDESMYADLVVPRISCAAECGFLQAYGINPIEDVPKDYKFTRWLLGSDYE
jgi:thymidylate synthase